LLERLGGDDHLVNVVALGALEDPEVETPACGHDAGEHHVSVAPCAGGAFYSSVDVVGQGTGFWHDASLKQAGARNTLSHR
jgi:hypothetical protein